MYSSRETSLIPPYHHGQSLLIHAINSSLPFNITMNDAILLVCSVEVGQPSGNVCRYGEPAHPGKVDALISMLCGRGVLQLLEGERRYGSGDRRWVGQFLVLSINGLRKQSSHFV